MRRIRQGVFGWILGSALFGLGTIAFAQPDEEMPANPVYVEDSPVVNDLVDHARTFRDQGRLLEAAKVYQQLIEQYGAKLIAQPDQLYVGTSPWVWNELRHDPAMLQAYLTAHESIAARKLDEAADQIEVLSALVRDYRFCRAGLEGALRLAGVMLERGRVTEAAAVLDSFTDHPNLADFGARYHQLQAAAGLFERDENRFKKHEKALSELSAPVLLEELEVWREAVQVSNAAVPSEESAVPRLPQPLGSPLWSQPLTTFTLPRSYRHLPEPQIAGDMVYVADYGQVFALERHSGQTRWVYPATHDEESRALMMNPNLMFREDPRGVSVTGNQVLCIVGLPAAAMQVNQQASYLACLDRDTGAQQWRLKPEDWDNSLANTSFQGTPVVVGQRVYVALRRVQRTQFQDAFIAAADLKTGKPLWHRHLASAMLMMHHAMPISGTQFTFQQGRIYAQDSLGVAACLDGMDGSVLWLRRLNGPLANLEVMEMRGGQVAPTFASSSPVLVAAGLIIEASGIGQSYLLLDPTTGQKINDLAGPGWNGVTRFLAAGRNVLTIGDRLRLVDGESLKLLTEAESVQGLQRDASVLVSDDRVLTINGENLVELSLPELKPLGSYPLSEAGNMALTDGQLVIAGIQAIHSYMNWDWAYNRLKQQLAADPADVEAGLALAHVSLAAGRYLNVLEGADLALAALASAKPEQSVNRRQSVFEQFLWFVQPDNIRDVETRRAMFDRLASLAEGPAGNVAYHLALGQFLGETGQLSGALDHYQIILNDPAMAAQMYTWNEGARRADMEARLRQAEIVKKQPALYERYHVLAAQELARLRGLSTAGASDYAAVAQRYPLSHSVADALLTAAQLSSAAKDEQTASRMLRQAYLAAESSEAATTVAGNAVQSLLDAGRVDQARLWLRLVQRDYPRATLARGDVAITSADWLAALNEKSVGAVTSSPALPALTPPLKEAVVLDGRLLLPSRRDDLADMGDLLVFQESWGVRLLDGPGMTERWRAAVKKPQQAPIELLSLTPAQVVFHLPHAQTLTAFDAVTGKVLWSNLALRPLLERAGSLTERRAAQPLQAQEFDQFINGQGVIVRQGRISVKRGNQGMTPLLLGTTEDVICISDRVGRVVGIDRHTGAELWRWMCPLEHVQYMLVSDSTLVLAGMRSAGAPGAGGQATMIVIADPATGAGLSDAIYLSQPPIWMTLHNGNAILAVNNTGAEAYDAATSHLLWRVDAGPANPRFMGQAFLQGDQLALPTPNGQLLWIDAVTGKQLEWLSNPAGKGDRLLDAEWIDNRWYLLAGRRAQEVDPKTQKTRSDAINAPNLVGQWISDRYVLLLNQTQPVPEVQEGMRAVIINGQRVFIREGQIPQQMQQMQQGPYSYRLFLLDRQSWSIAEEYDLDSADGPVLPEQCLLRDDQLFLTTVKGTILVKGANAP